MADKKNVAILGATGAVGTQMLQCLAERDFPVGELRLLASARSAGKKVEWCGRQIELVEATPEAFEGMDIVLGAAGDDVAKQLLPEAVRRGATVVDNSHAFRLYDEVPLVIPEINAGDIAKNQGIIANPNCATIIGLVPTWPLHKLGHVSRMVVSTYQAASGAGAPGMAELEAEICAMGRGEKLPEPRAFADQLASNLIPQIGSEKFEGYTSEEMKMQPVRALVSREVISDGAVEWRVRAIYALSNRSTATVDTVFHAADPAVTYDIKLDWHDKRALVKIAFDTNVKSDFVRNEIQFGHMSRPTTRNTSLDSAKFEVVNHRWSDLSDARGGVALLNVLPEVAKIVENYEGDAKTGVRIILRALEEPMRQIAANAGIEGSVIVDSIKKANKAGYGYDARRDEYCDMVERGIIDPTKVARSALQNAASIAAMVLTTESLVTDIPSKEPAVPAQPGGMGGMY